MPEPEGTELEVDVTRYLDIMLRRRWIIVSSVVIVILTTALITFTTRPIFQASVLLVIEKERGGGSANFGSGAMVERANDDYYQTQYNLLQSQSLLQKTYDELDLARTLDFADPNGFENFQKALVVVPVTRSRLVYVRANSHDPALAVRIADGISERFVQQNLANQLFISKDVLQALQAKQNDRSTRRSYDSLPPVVNNALIQTLKGEYAKLESQAAELSQRVTARHPALIALRSNMAALRSQIEAETDRIVQSMKTELSGQLSGNNVRIVDPAQMPKRPFAPKKRRNLILGFFAGLGLGIALALLVEMLDQSVRTQDDVETKLRQPFLGLIPQTELKGGRVFDALAAKELSLTSEAVRNIRTMVDFAGVGGKSKAIVVTSSVQGEGKTFVASNLAVALGQLGQNVLLIDGDLRRPKIHQVFEVSAERGFSDFLVTGRHAEDAAGLIQKSGVPGLSLLPCGPRPPNPSELLNTPRLGALIAWARENFDRVIVDCTPLFPINDTLLWGRHIASAVFVVRFGQTRAPLIRNACQKLLGSGIKPLGLVVNAGTPGGFSYASYGYYYQRYHHAYHQDPAPTKVS